ncbi:Lrp/AsnC ligand binding domain-containing protein [Candidatus Acetothermia bacterium]|nr:Lrp/AsnC ligand binding domain-containing protein [Candidatus Acetothermia bacterium]MBI3643796.1 Lrp/AsnC ligand binding domain-containing protein [Candidatus Acetothermia bacterium]
MAVQAYVLIRCEAGTATRVVEELRKKDHVARANSVFGDYDVIARVSVTELPSSFSISTLEEIVFKEIQKVHGVISTKTHIVTSRDPDFDHHN